MEKTKKKTINNSWLLNNNIMSTVETKLMGKGKGTISGLG